MAQDIPAIRFRNLRDLVFVCGFALLACHRLAAVARSEWNLLPLLNALPEDSACGAFIVDDIPIFAALLWLLAHRSAARWRSRLRADLVDDFEPFKHLEFDWIPEHDRRYFDNIHLPAGHRDERAAAGEPEDRRPDFSVCRPG